MRYGAPVPNKIGAGNRGRGRPKGAPNKTTHAAKEALALAFEGVGGVPALKKWAKDNQTEFYKLWSKLLPHEVSGPNGAPIVIDRVLRWGSTEIPL